MRIAKWGLAILLASLVGIAEARQQTQEQAEDSLAAAARRARERKKDQVKPTKVWDNDNIPTSVTSLSIVGNAPPAAENSANQPANVPGGSAAAGAANNAGADASKKSAVDAELAAARERLQTLQNDLDIAQRKFALDRQMYNAKPDYSADKAGAASLQEEQSQVEAKQQELADAKKRVADLEEKLNSASKSGTSSAPN